jgi:hypothetical protein
MEKKNTSNAGSGTNGLDWGRSPARAPRLLPKKTLLFLRQRI